MNGSDPGWPILMVGAQRSGTTALAHLVSAACAESEATFTVNGRLPYLLRRWWVEPDLDGRHARADDVAHLLRRRGPWAEGTLSLGQAERALRMGAGRVAESETAPRLAGEIRRICREAYGSERWGDKYNEYLLDLPWLAETFPEARWIFLWRDPGEVVASMLRWRGKPWNPATAGSCALKWADWNERWLLARTGIDRGRRIELRYRDLCAGGTTKLDEFLRLKRPIDWSGYVRRDSLGRGSALPPAACRVQEALAALTAGA